MPRRGSLLASALIAITVAGCGGAAGAGIGAITSARSGHDRGGPGPRLVATTETSSGLPAGWKQLRLTSGATLPYPASWQPVSGDPASASAALVNPDGTIRAYLNATPADGHETLAGWTHFRVAHNAAEGDRNLRLISARTGVRLAGGRASCVVDDYATSRSRYRELACIVAPMTGSLATVLVAAAQPNTWARERPLLDFALNHFTC